jgi:steroid 5-alpha reductase family enzyme
MVEVLKVMNPKLFSNIMSLPPLLIFFMLMKSTHFGQYSRVNFITQLAVFIPCVQIPAFRTGRLSYVDIAWPTGLLAMGVVSFMRSLHNLLFGDDKREHKSWGEVLRPFLASFAYIFQGGRMAFGAWTMFSVGPLHHEMQRYMYQRQRWAAAGITAGSFVEVLEIQKEAFAQCLANLGTLSMPLALQSCVPAGPMTRFELLSWCMWCASFVWEHVSDLQKLAFGRAMKKQGLRGKVCDFGLWNYTRHPNYFGEWMVWVSLTLASLPTLKRYLESEEKTSSMSLRAGIALGLLSVPTSMYMCLVHWTGATPAEFYSLKNRPDYARYIREVNCFFPGPRRLGA